MKTRHLEADAEPWPAAIVRKATIRQEWITHKNTEGLLTFHFQRSFLHGHAGLGGGGRVLVAALTWTTALNAGLSWTSRDLRTRAREGAPCIFFSGTAEVPATVYAAFRSSGRLAVRLRAKIRGGSGPRGSDAGLRVSTLKLRFYT